MAELRSSGQTSMSRAILEAIERRNRREARRRMSDHVRHAGELVARQFEQRERAVASGR